MNTAQRIARAIERNVDDMHARRITGERVGPFELQGEIVPVLLTPVQAIRLLDATAACCDDTGNISKKWFPRAIDRDDLTKAVEVLRAACSPLPEFLSMPDSRRTKSKT